MRCRLPRVLLSLISASLVYGQACPRLGMNTVEEAENQFYQNRKLEARRLLDKAYSQCRNDGPVLRRISEGFRLIGDDLDSTRFSKLADEVGARVIVRMTSSGPEPVTQLPTFVRRKFALVVGVSKFKDFTRANSALKPNEPIFQRIPDLQFAAKDAQDFANALLSPTGHFQKDRVEVIEDDKVTADSVRRGIANIEQNATEDDLVVLFFSSHGSSPDMDPAASMAKSSFILMHDTEYRNVLNTATAYPMYELVNAINRFRAKRVIAFLDTCYSGDTVAKGSRAIGGGAGSKGLMVGLQEAEEMMKAVPQDRARVVVTSSGANERSWESEGAGGNGYFTRFLLEALGKDSGQSNISQIYRYLSDAVPNAVAREKGGAPQHPQIRSYPNPQLEINIIIGSPETAEDAAR